MLAPYGYDEFGIPYSSPQDGQSVWVDPRAPYGYDQNYNPYPSQEAADAAEEARAKEVWGFLYEDVQKMTVEDIDYLDPLYMPLMDPVTEWDARPIDVQLEELKFNQMVDEEEARLERERLAELEEQRAINMRDNPEMGAMGAVAGGSPTVSLLKPVKPKK